jgi:hypothetical protein
VTDLLPKSFPIGMAAFLAGSSDKPFRRHVLPLLERDDHGYVLRTSLESFLGFAISVERYLAADRRMDSARENQRARNKAA